MQSQNATLNNETISHVSRLAAHIFKCTSLSRPFAFAALAHGVQSWAHGLHTPSPGPAKCCNRVRRSPGVCSRCFCVVLPNCEELLDLGKVISAWIHRVEKKIDLQSVGRPSSSGSTPHVPSLIKKLIRKRFSTVCPKSSGSRAYSSKFGPPVAVMRFFLSTALPRSDLGCSISVKPARSNRRRERWWAS